MKLWLSLALNVLTFEVTVFGQSRVYRGHAIDISDAPYMVFIRYKTSNTEGASVDYLCGGTILKENYILTAGHCTSEETNNTYKKLKAELYEIRVGSTYHNTGGTLYKVSEVIPNPRYTPDSPAHDIGLLKLSSNIKYSKTVQNVPLGRANESYMAEDPVFTQGWGSNPENPDAPELYRVYLSIVNSTYCSDSWGPDGGSVSEYEKHEICAYGPNGADACSGDSGGPLVLKSTGRQIGVVSYGETCAENDDDSPGLYSSIKDNLKWISCVTGGIN